jgi:hypothetical protein
MRHALRWIVGLSLVALLGSACAADDAAPRELKIDAVPMQVQIPDAQFSAGAEPLLDWVRRSADIVTRYYGRFPVAELRIRVQPVGGDGVQGGTTFGQAMGHAGGFIRVRVGRDVTPAQLVDDWVLVHEMIHLALPDVGEEHAWLSEGIAVYAEGISRAQAGNRTVEDVWTEQFHSMPKGLPQAGDRGLDNTHTWGRTYWGGALFCLEADVEIHRRTHNRYGLQDALRAVNRDSGGLVADWPVDRVFSSGDRAVGVPVLEELYAQMKDSPVAPDLPALWHQLGVEPGEHSMRLRDDAPLADVRQAIMRPEVAH